MSIEKPIVTREHLAGLRAAQMLWDRSGPAAHFPKALQELIDLARSAPLAPAVAVPEGYALVPTRMELLPEDIAAIMFHCGGDEDATEIDEQYQAGLLWIGEVQDDDGNKVYGLNIACYECLEEGSTPLVELATTPAPVLQAYMAGVPLLSSAAQDVLAERNRQITAEGWTPAHDDEHACDEIAAFACFYAMPPAARDWDASSTGYGQTLGEALKPEGWQGKTGDRRRELIKAGALILAEIERLDRAAAKQVEQEQQP